MRRISGVPTRSEVTETVHRNEEDMSEKVDALDTIATDTETVRETLDSLEFEGTAEGIDAVERAMDEAEDVTVEIFEQEDEDLEEMQSEAQDYEDELQERSDTSESDLGRISDASAQIETPEPVDKLLPAKTALLEDMDFLNEEIENDKEAREESARLQEEHRRRVQKGR